MKSYNHLMEELVSDDNLDGAIMTSSLGKRDRKDVKYCLTHKEKVKRRVRFLLWNGYYVPPNHPKKEINDGIKMKKRKIVCPSYMYEQIVHHAIVKVISPIIKKSLYEYSCASIPGRGVHLGKKYIERFTRKHPEKCKYVLKMDVYHFFPSIDHRILKAKIRKTFHDDKFCKLLETILDNYNDRTNRGLPIGFYTSQWLANWYLSPLDHYIKEVLRADCYVRYNDDMVIFGNNKKRLHGFRRQIESYLLHELGLRLKPNWQVFRFDSRPLDFMGFRFHPDKTTLRRTILLRATRKARSFKDKKVTWYTASQMLCYLAWLKTTNTYAIFLRYVKPYVSKRDLRKCISRHGRRMNVYALNMAQEPILQAA